MINNAKPTPVTVGGTQWPVLFTFRGWRALTDRYSDIDGALAAAQRADQAMVAVFFWAGLLWDNPGLTPEAVTAILDEGTLAELEALPLALLRAMQATQPKGDSGSGGDPWDWEVAEAVWATEWGQDPEAFDRQTFESFCRLSNGRAKLYASTKQDHGPQIPADGWSLADLARMNRGGR